MKQSIKEICHLNGIGFPAGTDSVQEVLAWHQNEGRDAAVFLCEMKQKEDDGTPVCALLAWTDPNLDPDGDSIGAYNTRKAIRECLYQGWGIDIHPIIELAIELRLFWVNLEEFCNDHFDHANGQSVRQLEAFKEAMNGSAGRTVVW